jgi:hypothetical protein
MSRYRRVVPSFWTGETGKRLRSRQEAQLVALYLMTGPHANMIGLYHCPITYISHDTGIDVEAVSNAVRQIGEEGFCTFDEERELVWVREMARFQVDEFLKPKDKRITFIAKELAALPKCPIIFAFYERYCDDFLLHGRDELEPLRRALQGASMPLRSQYSTVQAQAQKNPSQGGELSEYSCREGRGRRPTLAVVNGAPGDDGEDGL